MRADERARLKARQGERRGLRSPHPRQAPPLQFGAEALPEGRAEPGRSYGQVTAMPASPSGRRGFWNALVFAAPKTHCAEVPTSLGPAIPGLLV